MSERFYVNSPLSPGPLEMTGTEAHHLAQVCRLHPGDPLRLFNGDGHEYPARVISLHKRTVLVEVLSQESPDRELNFTLEIAAPLPKGDRAQFLIEKLTELGATQFTPLACEHGVIKPGPGKLEKLRRHVIEASKQCGRNRLMTVGDVADWSDYCRVVDQNETRIVAHPGGLPVTSLLPGSKIRQSPMRMAVGPEGGFTQDEIDLARSQGWQVVDLGPRILRMETAALALTCLAVMRCTDVPRGT